MTPEGSVFVMSQSESVSEGNSVTFICVVDVAGSYELQWSHNGEELPGQNQTILNVNAVTVAQGGNYTCSVVNVAGSGMDMGILYGMSHCSSRAQRAYVSVSQPISNSFTVIFDMLALSSSTCSQCLLCRALNVSSDLSGRECHFLLLCCWLPCS